MNRTTDPKPMDEATSGGLLFPHKNNVTTTTPASEVHPEANSASEQGKSPTGTPVTASES